MPNLLPHAALGQLLRSQAARRMGGKAHGVQAVLQQEASPEGHGKGSGGSIRRLVEAALLAQALGNRIVQAGCQVDGQRCV